MPGTRRPVPVRQEVVAVDDVDLERRSEAPQCRPEPGPSKRGDTGQQLEPTDVVEVDAPEVSKVVRATVTERSTE